MSNAYQYGFQCGLGFNVTGTRTAYALDTAFTLGSAGKCVGFRFIAPATTTITDVVFFLTAAPGSAHDLSVNACSQTTSVRPGSALTNGSVTVSGGTTAGVWVKATFGTPPNVTVGTGYWIVIGDPSGAASNYSVLSQGSHCSVGINAYPSSHIFRTYTSTAGFSADGSGAGIVPPCCIVFGDGSYIGSPYTLASTADASAALERGWRITPDEDVTISWICGNPPAGSLKVYPDGQNPGGTIYSGFNGGAAFSIPTSAQQNTAVSFPPCTLLAGQTYRIVIDPTAATTAPGYVQIEDDTSHATILEACGFPGIAMQHTEEAAGPVWTDSPSKAPRYFLGISSLPLIDTPVVGNVTEDDTVRGATGTYHEAAASEVQNGVQFGAGGTEYTGSYTGSGGGRPAFGDRTGGKF